jgi:hypothetical protein
VRISPRGTALCDPILPGVGFDSLQAETGQ